jgi:hypothetical protein
LEAFKQLRQYGPAGRLARQLGRLAEAAALFGQAGQPFDAGLCFAELGDTQGAFGQLVKVPRDDPRYREACLHAVRAASALGALDFQLEHLVGPLIRTQPEDDPEREAFYLLAGLYEQHDLPDNAAECLR